MAIANRVREGSQHKFRIAAKIAMVQRGLSVTALAKKIGCSRNGVSLAINHGLFKGTRNKVALELGLKELR